MRSETQNAWDSEASAPGRGGGGSDAAYRRQAEVGSHIASSSMHLYTDNSQSASHADTRSASRDEEAGQPAQGRRLHTPLTAIPSRGARGVKGAYASAAGAMEASPPPRIPLEYGTPGGVLGAGRNPAASAGDDVYEESDEEGMGEDGDEEAYDEEDEEGEYGDGAGEEEDEEWEDLDTEGDSDAAEPNPEAAIDGQSHAHAGDTGAAAAAAAAPRDARALRFDSEESTHAAHPPRAAALPGVTVALPAAFRREVVDSALRPPATAVKAAPASSAFRRATPTTRVAYSVGYDAAAGQSSTEPSSASPPCQEAEEPSVVDASQGSRYAGAAPPTAVTFTATNTFSSAAAEGRRTSSSTRPTSAGNEWGQQTPEPSAVPPSREGSAPAKTLEQSAHDVHQRQSASRHAFTSMAATPASSSTVVTPAQSSEKRRTAVFHDGDGTPATTGASTATVTSPFSPLPPPRPTLEEVAAAPAAYQQNYARLCSTRDQHVRSGSDGDSSLCYSAAAMSPVLALDDGEGTSLPSGTGLYRGGDNVWVRRPSASATATITADATLHVVPASAATSANGIITPTSLDHSARGSYASASASASTFPKPALTAAAGRSRTMADLLAEWKDTTTAVDIARSACEREAHVRSLSGATGSPVFESSPRVMSPVPTRESPMELGDSTRSGSPVVAAGGLQARRERAENAGHVQRAVNQQHEQQSQPLLPPVTVKVSVTNVFNYTQSDTAWLTRGLLPEIDARAATQRTRDKSISSAQAGVTSSASSPSATPAVTVFLYARPLLLHVPQPASHGESALVGVTRLFLRVLLLLLYVIPRTVVVWLTRTAHELLMALAVLTVLVLAVDAAFERWPVLWAVVADARSSVAALASMLLDAVSAAGWAGTL